MFTLVFQFLLILEEICYKEKADFTRVSEL
jgi:hypothetical protein